VSVRTGLDVLLAERPRLLQGKRVGLVVHAASVDHRLEHAAQRIASLPGVELAALFGPQHGITTHTQDNMIEWEGEPSADGPRIHSLYGRTRKPTPEQLADLDLLIFDLQDVGSRYYTYIQTLSLCMEACGEQGIPLLVLDRPNPIGGLAVEGPVLEPEFRSFVGFHPIAVRHGLTVAECAHLFRNRFGVQCALELVLMRGWERRFHFPDCGLPWVLPSPNMPTYDTALVYPGMCLLEGTLLSEGRGTCRPFELFGAPFIEPERLIRELRGLELPGVHFRPAWFQPTFQKWANQLCGGAQIHVLDREAFLPVKTAVAILWTVRRLHPGRKLWRDPPYEYEENLLPIDILAGTDRLRLLIDSWASWRELSEWLDESPQAFREERGDWLLYA
jgi:uncharacterized protein YbbC (DUF1343 family)